MSNPISRGRICFVSGCVGAMVYSVVMLPMVVQNSVRVTVLKLPRRVCSVSVGFMFGSPIYVGVVFSGG